MCSLLLLVSMNALVGRRLLLLFQALSRKSSSDPVRPFVRVCIYKETSSSFASTMPPTRTHKRNKIRSFFSHRIYFTLCVCLLITREGLSGQNIVFYFRFFFSDSAVAPEELDRPSRDGSKQRIVFLPFSGHATFLE